MYFKGSLGIILDKFSKVYSVIKIIENIIETYHDLEFKFPLHQALEWNLHTST